MAALQRLSEARARACLAQPYLRVALQAIRPVESQFVPTLAIDPMWRMFWSPAFVERCTPEELACGLVHECWHVLRAHNARREVMGAIPQLFGIAGDLEINDDLRSLPNGLVLIEGALHPETFSLQPGGLAEGYYQDLLKDAKRITIQLDLGDASGEGSCEKGSCGSGGGGKPAPGEERAAAGARAGGQFPDGVSSAEAQMVTRAVAEAVRQQSSQARGTVPMGVQRWAEEVLGPSKIDWRRRLAAKMRGALSAVGMADYTYSRVSRRASSAWPFILPALRSPKPRVAVVVDTSGSVEDGALGIALREVRGVLKVAGVEGVSFYACDSDVHARGRVRTTVEAKRLLVGGGGTDMVEGIWRAAKGNPRPNVIVVLTDGYTPWPTVPIAKVKIVAAIYGDGPSDECPPFISIVRVGDVV